MSLLLLLLLAAVLFWRPSFSAGWGNYVYFGNNTVSILTGAQACYSTVTLQLGYVIAPPVISTLGPLNGPETGETNVTLTGTGFRSPAKQNITCIFGATHVNATYVSDTVVKCEAPPGTGVVPLMFKAYQDGILFDLTQDGQTQLFITNFTYYGTSLSLSPRPPSGPPASNVSPLQNL